MPGPHYLPDREFAPARWRPRAAHDWLTVVCRHNDAVIVAGLLLERHPPSWPVWPILLSTPAIVV